MVLAVACVGTLSAFAAEEPDESEEPEIILATTLTQTRSEIDQMATLWETDTVVISPLATAQYPQFSGSWQYSFPNSNISADEDIHINMAVNSAGTGRTGNNLGTSSPIVGEVINATNSQLNYLAGISSGRYAPRGIFRFYTEHFDERHFEIHPLTQLLRWNGSAFVVDADYHANIAGVADGATHATSTYTSLLNGSQTVSATVASDNVNVTFTFPSPSVNYVQYNGTALSGLTSDAVSSYFLFQPAPGAERDGQMSPHREHRSKLDRRDTRARPGPDGECVNPHGHGGGRGPDLGARRGPDVHLSPPD